MFEFVNPMYLAGGSLISLPIIIHLINRMRFKRIRWAAMEFLLKSQKRNRRRLIIEQILLLLLRIFLVVLAVWLVARYIGFSFAGLHAQNVLHVVLLDDTLSMSDQWKEEGEKKNSFALGKELIVKQIAKNALKGRSLQRLVLLTLSQPGTILFDQQVDQARIEDLEKLLDEVKCTDLHVDPAKGVQAARDIFDKNAQDRRLFYIVSDFRHRDWSGPDSGGLTKAVEGLVQAGVKISLVDTAHPFRAATQRETLYHDNLGIIELRPETRVAAKDMLVQFTVTVHNFSASESKNVRVTVKANGQERPEGSLTLLSVPPGATSATFQLVLDELGFNQVTANLEPEEAGIQGDNTRYAVVEVRNQVPVLMIDGDPSNGLKPGGDTFHLQTVFSAAKGYEVVRAGVQELEKPNLDQYPSIYLLNVPRLTENGLKNLQQYVQDGGSVAFFLGERIDPEYYNTHLYAQGKGIFPAPLAGQPSLPAYTTPEEKGLKLADQQFKIFLRNEAQAHPIFAEVYGYRSVFKWLPIERYYPVPRARWNPGAGQVVELVTMPNQRSVDDYREQAQELIGRLPLGEDKYARYHKGLEQHQRAIRDSLIPDKQLYQLANALDALLNDQGDPKDPDRPNLVEFWGQPELRDLRAQFAKLLETVQLGDPLVIAAHHGKGRVVAFLTTAGQRWNNWAGGSPASGTYPVIMVEMQKYLTGVTGAANLTVGTPLEIQLDATRFEPGMRRFYQPETRPPDAAGAGAAGAQAAGLVDLKEQLGRVSGNRVTFDFDEARQPGVYLFDFTQKNPDNGAGAQTRTERRAYVFNVDTAAEGDLPRSNTDELERLPAGAAAGSIRLLSPQTTWEDLVPRQSDMSETPWFFLLILVILVVEQALAVHLSFHLKGGEALPPAQAVGPRATAA
jgi:antitoxin (DNA-binding transcriptional repressor) of toxin-antitoxin stability system